jgi:hypothetical protein
LPNPSSVELGKAHWVRRRSTSEIKWSEWISTAKENGHGAAY